MVDWKDLQQLDYQVSYRISMALNFHGTTRKLVQIFTLSGTSFFWFFGVIIGYFIFPNYRLEAYSIMFTTILMLFPVFIIKHTVRRHRPEFKDTRFGTTAFDEWSFPSGHASRATYLVILLSTYSPQLLPLWLIWGFMIVLSRLLLGVHYVSDIIAGILVSGIFILILFVIGWLPFAPLSSYFVL